MSGRTSTAAKAVKAYLVQEEDEGTGGVVFAKSSAEARRRGSSQFGDGDFNWGKARRAPGFDKYAEVGRVPWIEMFKSGWWCECHGCGCTIREDEYDEDDELIEFDIVEVGSAVYCRPSCREKYLAEEAEVKRITEWTIADLTSRLLAAMPGAVLSNGRHDRPHVYVPRRALPMAPQQAVISFMFPGGRYPGHYRFDKLGQKPQATIARGDIVAFHAWKSAGYPPHMMDASA